MRLAMAQIPWGRADEFGDFMRVLKFRTINLDYRAGFAK